MSQDKTSEIRSQRCAAETELFQNAKPRSSTEMEIWKELRADYLRMDCKNLGYPSAEDLLKDLPWKN